MLFRLYRSYGSSNADHCRTKASSSSKAESLRRGELPKPPRGCFPNKSKRCCTPTFSLEDDDAHLDDSHLLRCAGRRRGECTDAPRIATHLGTGVAIGRLDSSTDDARGKDRTVESVAGHGNADRATRSAGRRGAHSFWRRRSVPRNLWRRLHARVAADRDP